MIQTWDAAEHLKTSDEMAAYLEAALEEDDPALIAAVLSDIARARGMMDIVRQTNLQASGKLEFAAVLKTIHALGLKLHASVV